MKNLWYLDINPNIIAHSRRLDHLTGPKPYLEMYSMQIEIINELRSALDDYKKTLGHTAKDEDLVRLLPYRSGIEPAGEQT